MTKTILIPTDFTVRSLQVLSEVLSNAPFIRHKIILLYGEQPSDSITEMLFFRKAKVIRDKYKPEFTEALEMIKNRFESRIESLVVDMISQNSRSALVEYLNNQGVAEIFVHGNLKLKPPGNAFDFTRNLKYCNIPVTSVTLEQHSFAFSEISGNFSFAYN